MTKVHLDFETRSEANIWDCGAWMYTVHPSTKPLCVVFAVDDGPVELVRLCENFVEGPEGLKEHESFRKLEALAKDPNVLFYAHNAFFEQAVWINVIQPWYGFVPIPVNRWRCTRAKALVYGYPPSLGKAALAARIPELKDMAGKGIMLKMCIPRRPNKNEDPTQVYYHYDPADFQALYDYCKQDVIVERALDNKIPDLSPEEQELWFTDQTINLRGVLSDKPFVERMVQMLEYHNYTLNAELKAFTNGEIERGSEIATIVRYLKNRGVPINDLQAQTVTDLIKSERLGEHEINVLRYRQELGKSSNAKYAKLKATSDDGGIVRDCFMYHRAVTGRWGGQGVQTQNLPINRIGADILGSIGHFKELDYATLKLVYGRQINDVASVCLRGVFLPRPGNELYVVDYNAIEARVVMWLANDPVGLKEFADSDAGLNEDIYVMMARRIYNDATLLKKKDGAKRIVGKHAILGCGFQCGGKRFMEMCKSFEVIISLDFAEDIVRLYRNTYNRVPQFWYDMQNVAMWCVNNPGQSAQVRYINWYYDRQRDILFCRLPSGRFLCYHEPRIGNGKFGPALSFMTEVKNQWMRKDSYGGHLVENVTQATARDLMGRSMPVLEKAGYPIVLMCHDELVVEKLIGDNKIQEMINIMCSLPNWAPGLPIKAEGYVTGRYMKL